MKILRLSAILAMVAVPSRSAVRPKPTHWDRNTLNGQLAPMDDQAVDPESQNDELQNQMSPGAAQLASDAQALGTGDTTQNPQSLITQTQTVKQALMDAAGASGANQAALNVGGVPAQHVLDAPAQQKPSSVNSIPNVAGGSVQAIIENVFQPLGQASVAWALCIASHESSFRPNVCYQNSVQQACGLFQFEPRTWAGTPYAGYSRFDPVANTKAARWLFERDGPSPWSTHIDCKTP